MQRTHAKVPVMQQAILQLKVTLIATDPPVWRRVLVPAEYSFADLHATLQDALGWTESHFHHFLTANPFKRNAAYKRIGPPMPEEFTDEEPVLDERKEKISAWLAKPDDMVFYEYDFGDSWMHEVTLEKILPAQPKDQYPQLVDGARACPPEDCGGPCGYARVIETLADPNNEEHDEILEWLGLEDASEFDPARFDPKQVAFRDSRKPKRRGKLRQMTNMI
jgi:Plasmid pRiA4b ORF-3-like protein